jgi:hypothetical protein
MVHHHESRIILKPNSLQSLDASESPSDSVLESLVAGVNFPEFGFSGVIDYVI